MNRQSPLLHRLSLGLAALVLLGTACQAGTTATPSGAPAVTVALKGEFHAVDGQASGVAELVRLADGSYEVVLDSFNIAGIDHLNLVLAKSTDIKATVDVDQAALLDLGPLSGTTGMQAYPVPPEMSAGVMDYHTAVIWDSAMLHAIAAAPLSQP